MIHRVQLEYLVGNVNGNDSELHGGPSISMVEAPLDAGTLRPLTKGGAHTICASVRARRSRSGHFANGREEATLDLGCLLGDAFFQGISLMG